MPCFDVSLKGFRCETDETDHLVKWIQSPDRFTLDRWLQQQGLTEYVQDITELENSIADSYTFKDGVDVVLETVALIDYRVASQDEGFLCPSIDWADESRKAQNIP